MPARIKIPPEAGAEHAKEPLAIRGQRWYFYFFFVSGFCSILYELIWLRLAMAQFGVTTAMVSIVLSSFMAGLGLGSWAAGHFVRKYARRLQSPPLQVYAITELVDWLFRGRCAIGIAGALCAGAHGKRAGVVLVGLLRGSWSLDRVQSDSVVRVHGGYDSAGHVCHP